MLFVAFCENSTFTTIGADALFRSQTAGSVKGHFQYEFVKLLISLVRDIKLCICHEEVREFWKPLAVASIKTDYVAEI